MNYTKSSCLFNTCLPSWSKIVEEINARQGGAILPPKNFDKPSRMLEENDRLFQLFLKLPKLVKSRMFHDFNCHKICGNVFLDKNMETE